MFLRSTKNLGNQSLKIQENGLILLKKKNKLKEDVSRNEKCVIYDFLASSFKIQMKLSSSLY